MAPAELGQRVTARRALELTRTALQRGTADDRGFVLCERSGAFSVAVGRDTIDRALAILQALSARLLDEGMCIVDGENGGPVSVSVEGEALPFALIEDKGRRKHELTADERGRSRTERWLDPVPEWDYFPSGVLALEIRAPLLYGRRRRWGEGKRGPLEDRLDGFIECLRKAAAVVRERRMEVEERERLLEERKRANAAAAEARRLEGVRRAELLAEVEAWRTTRGIRAYVEAARAAWVAAGKPDDGFEGWARWAEEAAASIEPTRLRTGDTRA